VTIRVLVVDDEELVRTGLRLILDAEPDIGVVGTASDGRQAVAEVRRLCPDVVLMDIRMPGLDGLEATRRILTEPDVPPCKVVILTTFDVDEHVYEALRAGASGFLLRTCRPTSWRMRSGSRRRGRPCSPRRSPAG
jgi:DNA-binding NarL/FixJ family response regulator